MQKIMFEHKRFRLEQAVIAGTKTMTRRRVLFPKGINDKEVKSAVMGIDRKGRVYFTFSTDIESFDIYPKYQIGERVAVAQSYSDIFPDVSEELDKKGINLNVQKDGTKKGLVELAGWDNKMFVRADAMPHVIQITDIKAERLQDISCGDCLKEGITTITEGMNKVGNAYGWDSKIDALKRDLFFTPRAAFASLIDRLSGRGTWERNEWQFAYIFKLIK